MDLFKMAAFVVLRMKQWCHVGHFCRKMQLICFIIRSKEADTILRSQVRLRGTRVLFMQWELRQSLEIKCICRCMMPRVKKSQKETIP